MALAAPDIDSYARYLDLNEAFHSEIVTLAKNSMLRRRWSKVKSVPFASPSAMVYVRSKLPRAPQILAVSHEHHRAIVEAIERKQGRASRSPGARTRRHEQA